MTETKREDTETADSMGRLVLNVCQANARAYLLRDLVQVTSEEDDLIRDKIINVSNGVLAATSVILTESDELMDRMEVAPDWEKIKNTMPSELEIVAQIDGEAL